MQEAPFTLPDADLAGVQTTPVPEHVPSKQEISRARRAYWTRTLATVVACEHKFDSARMPRNNCEYCWEAFFKTAVDLGKLHDELSANGVSALTAKYGAKYVKHFQRFLNNELRIAEKGIDGVSEETQRS